MSLKYTDVELDKITASKYQQHLLVNYENKRLLIQTPWMTLSHYGIPKCDKFHTTEESRRYLQIPLNDDKFNEFIHSLDGYVLLIRFVLELLYAFDISYFHICL